MLTLRTCVFVTVHLESFSSEIVVVVVVRLVRRSFEFQRLALLMADSIMEIETFLHIVFIHLLLVWRCLLFLLMQTFYYWNYIFFEQISVQCTCIHNLYICCVPTTLFQSIAHEIQNLSNHYDGRIFWAIDRTTCHLLLNVLSVCLWFVCMYFFFSDFFSKPNISFTRYFPLQHHFQSRFFNCNFFFRENILFIHFNACVFIFSLSWRRLFIQNSYFINRMRYSCVYCTTHCCFLFVHFVHSRVFLARWISIWWNYLAFFAQPPNVQRVMITKVCAISIFRCKNRNVACDVHARHNFSSSK